MIIAAAGYFLEPLSIVFLALFARINAFGSVDSYSQFSDSYVKASVFLSLMICFGVGTYHAFGTPSKRFSLPQGYKAMKH
ncbi:hypothetical protein BDR26DRAFT_78561 [Obelidium mucronatum]|nr:hypothetical protein BDR26DRAFT_78561 [Obelidium mucronatum]